MPGIWGLQGVGGGGAQGFCRGRLLKPEEESVLQGRERAGLGLILGWEGC